MSDMRTTLTLDDDLALELKKIARTTGLPFKEIVNRTLYRGLARGDKPVASAPPFRVEARAGGFRQGIDLRKLNQLYDELEAEGLNRALGEGETNP